MAEELRTEAMEIIVSGVEKYSENMELACKMIKETMDKKYGEPWHVRCSPNAPRRAAPTHLLQRASASGMLLTLRGAPPGRRGRGLRLHCAVRGEALVLYVLRRDGAAHRNSAVQVLCYVSQPDNESAKKPAGSGVGQHVSPIQDRLARRGRGCRDSSV